MIKENLYQKELNKISNQIIKNYQPDKIILFGSLADGEIKEDTDIDLLVIKNTSQTYRQRVKKLSEILSKISIKVPKDILNITLDELKERLSMGDYFIKSIINNGKVIYEKKI